VSKATPNKKAKATPKKAKAAGGEDDDESPSKKGGRAKLRVKTEDGDDEVVESVEGPKGIALRDDSV
jgi:hypothetical protein